MVSVYYSKSVLYNQGFNFGLNLIDSKPIGRMPYVQFIETPDGWICTNTEKGTFVFMI